MSNWIDDSGYPTQAAPQKLRAFERDRLMLTAWRQRTLLLMKRDFRVVTACTVTRHKMTDTTLEDEPHQVWGQLVWLLTKDAQKRNDNASKAASAILYMLYRVWAKAPYRGPLLAGLELHLQDMIKAFEYDKS